MRMLALAAVAAIALSPYDEYSAAVAACKADYAAGLPSYRYLDFGAYGDEQAEAAQQAWKFWQPHVDRSTSLAHQMPHIAGGIYRVDVEALGWGKSGWVAALAGYPYATFQHHGDLLVARADWLLAYGADASRKTGLGQENEIYFKLLFGGKVPKNKAEWLAGFGIVEKLNEREKFQVVPKAGPGAKGGGRRLIALHRQDLVWWETFDSARPSGLKDPALGFGQFNFDAGEQILGMFKTLPTGSYEDVRVQAYLLTDKNQNKVNVATNDVVEDKQHFAGEFSIRVPGTCINCHTAGLLGSQSNYFIEYLRRPGLPQLLVDDAKKAPKFDAAYLGKLGKEIRRSNEDVALWTLDYLDSDPKTAVRNWREIVELYDRDLDLAQAAREIHATPNDLRLALGHWSAIYGPQKQFTDAADLTAVGGTVPRHQWEDVTYRQCVEAYSLWRGK